MSSNGLFCADVPLRNYSLTHLSLLCDFNTEIFIFSPGGILYSICPLSPTFVPDVLVTTTTTTTACLRNRKSCVLCYIMLTCLFPLEFVCFNGCWALAVARAKITNITDKAVTVRQSDGTDSRLFVSQLQLGKYTIRHAV